jgi:hypothetical protein
VVLAPDPVHDGDLSTVDAQAPVVDGQREPDEALGCGTGPSYSSSGKRNSGSVWLAKASVQDTVCPPEATVPASWPGPRRASPTATWNASVSKVHSVKGTSAFTAMYLAVSPSK